MARLAGGVEAAGPFDGGLEKALKAEYRMACRVVDDLVAKREERELAVCLGFRANRWLTWGQRAPYYFHPNRTQRELAAGHRRLIANAGRVYADMDWNDFGENEPGRFALLRPNLFGEYLIRILVPGLEKSLETKCRTEGVRAGSWLWPAPGFRGIQGEPGPAPGRGFRLPPVGVGRGAGAGAGWGGGRRGAGLF